MGHAALLGRNPRSALFLYAAFLMPTSVGPAVSASLATRLNHVPWRNYSPPEEPPDGRLAAPCRSPPDYQVPP